MALSLVLLFLGTFSLMDAQVTTSTSTQFTSTTPPPWTNPAWGGKQGNPGAALHISNKTTDAVHAYATDALARNIQSSPFGHVSIPIGLALLTVMSPRITESKLAGFEYELIKPNRIRSRFYGGRFAGEGTWQYKPAGSRNYQAAFGGRYRASIVDGEVIIINQFGRNSEFKPMIQTIDCQANFSRFRVDLQGAPNLTSIEHCDNPICDKIVGFYEDAVCQFLRTYVRDVIDARLATFPVRVNITDDVKVDYGVLNNYPNVLDHIDTALEGRILWRGMGSVPFYPPTLVDVRKAHTMLSFGVSDYTFNTLFHQAHAQGYRYSAADLLSKVPAIQSQLKLNCTDRIVLIAKQPKFTIGSTLTAEKYRSSLCLGALLENFTIPDQFSPDDIGDLVYKSEQKAPSVLIWSDRTAYFDAGTGNLDIYGPALENKARQLLARVVIEMLRGEFIPKWNGVNITGAIKITSNLPGQTQNEKQIDCKIKHITQNTQNP